MQDNWSQLSFSRIPQALRSVSTEQHCKSIQNRWLIDLAFKMCWACSRTRCCTLSTFNQRLHCLQHWKWPARQFQRRKWRYNWREASVARGATWFVFLRCPSFLRQCQDIAMGQGTKPAKTAPLPTLSKPLASDAFGLAFACCFMVHGALVSKHALECKAASKADRSCSFQTNRRFPPKSMRWKNDWRWQTNALHIICCTWALDGIVAF